MVSKKTIKEYDFNSINEYFEYIIESLINGQPQQAKELVKNLSKKQKRACLNYFEFQIEQSELLDKLLKLLGAEKIENCYFII